MTKLDSTQSTKLDDASDSRRVETTDQSEHTKRGSEHASTVTKKDQQRSKQPRPEEAIKVKINLKAKQSSDKSPVQRQDSPKKLSEKRPEHEKRHESEKPLVKVFV